LADRYPEIFEGKHRTIPKPLKIAIHISELFPGSFIASLRPDTIIFPELISKRESQIIPIGQMETYNKLLGQTIFSLDKDISRHQLRVLGKLVKQTKGYQFLSGRDIYDDPKKLLVILGKINK
jgi:hypothetical protein